jgi:hypothetical protein
MEREAVFATVRFVLPILLFAAAARADIIYLKNGQLEGKVIGRENGRVKIRIATSQIVTTIDEDDILGIEPRRTPRDIYLSMADQVRPDDAEAHYALAMWCRDHGLKDEMTAELVATLKLDPDHERARGELGYVKTEDGWKTREEAMRAKGMVRVKGRWMTPAEAEKLEQEEKHKKLLLGINAVVYRIHSGSAATARRMEEALAQFDHPALAWKIARLLEDRDAVVRRAACASLAAMNYAQAAPELARLAIVDPAETVREAALDAAIDLSPERSANTLYDLIAKARLKTVRSRADQKVLKRVYRRIALALDRIGDIRSVPFLIEILYPSIEIIGDTGPTPAPLGITRVNPGPTAVDITQGGIVLGTGHAFPVPGAPERYYFNRAAEDALRRLTGQDLGVQPKDWGKWWKAHAAELLRKQEAEEREDKDEADRLLEEAAGERD